MAASTLAFVHLFTSTGLCVSRFNFDRSYFLDARCDRFRGVRRTSLRLVVRNYKIDKTNNDENRKNERVSDSQNKLFRGFDRARVGLLRGGYRS
jgi:hypothetical protein